jgi:hypothetical protein
MSWIASEDARKVVLREHYIRHLLPLRRRGASAAVYLPRIILKE